ncbi:Uncharacterized protein FWK35_00027798, partial [Aphis craccivora]
MQIKLYGFGISIYYLIYSQHCQGVIHFETLSGQLPVIQMLSECHNISQITYWLSEWSTNTKITKIIVCDHSMALLGAIARSLAGEINLKTYMDKLFSVVMFQSNLNLKTFIRIDYAHVMKFLIYLKDIPKKNNELSRETAKLCLKQSIAGMDEIYVSDNEDNDLLLTQNIPNDENEDGCLKTWIDSIKKKSTLKYVISSTNCMYEKDNFHYLPDFSISLLKLLWIYPLWSAIVIKYFNISELTASSSSVESYFNDLNNRTLHGDNLPLRVDKFYYYRNKFQKIMVTTMMTVFTWSTLHLQKLKKTRRDWLSKKEENIVLCCTKSRNYAYNTCILAR